MSPDKIMTLEEGGITREAVRYVFESSEVIEALQEEIELDIIDLTDPNPDFTLEKRPVPV